jgi:hypothetical protein
MRGSRDNSRTMAGAIPGAIRWLMLQNRLVFPGACPGPRSMTRWRHGPKPMAPPSETGGLQPRRNEVAKCNHEARSRSDAGLHTLADGTDDPPGNLSGKVNCVNSLARARLSASDSALSRVARPAATGEGASESLGWCKRECKPTAGHSRSSVIAQPRSGPPLLGVQEVVGSNPAGPIGRGPLSRVDSGPFLLTGVLLTSIVAPSVAGYSFFPSLPEIPSNPVPVRRTTCLGGGRSSDSHLGCPGVDGGVSMRYSACRR